MRKNFPISKFWKNQFLGLLCALQFFTIIRITKKVKVTPTRFATTYIPVCGAIVGTISGYAYYLTFSIFHSYLAATIAIFVQIILTGALHLDGLADCADAIFGGKDIESRQRILKDPSLGTFGVLAILIFLLVDIFSLSRFAPINGLKIMIILNILSRLPFISLMYLSNQKKEVGTTSSLTTNFQADISKVQVVLSNILLIPFIIFFGWKAISLLLVIILISIKWYRLCIAKLGRFNGDCYGALNEILIALNLILLVTISR